MNSNSYSASTKILAIIISIGLHLLLLWISYYITINKPASIGKGYAITLVAATNQSSSTAQKKQPTTNKKTLTKQEPKKAQVTKKATPKKTAVIASKNKTIPAETPKPPIQEEKTVHVDERSLYKSQESKQSGVKLDLAGWLWDQAPKPKDDTDESGKITFEIKIDEFGEVIAVKTLEKSISPLVEKIYKDALTELTFSRTSDNLAYSPVYQGKVTFILRTQ